MNREAAEAVKRGEQHYRKSCFEGGRERGRTFYVLIDLLVPLTFLDKIRLTPWLGWLRWPWGGRGCLSPWWGCIGIPDLIGEDLCLIILLWFGCIEEDVDADSTRGMKWRQVQLCSSLKMTVSLTKNHGRGRLSRQFHSSSLLDMTTVVDRDIFLLS